MEIAKSTILEALRERGQNARADWVDGDMPDLVDTVRHAGLLSLLGLSAADLDAPAPAGTVPAAHRGE
jgi:hypothetical protein